MSGEYFLVNQADAHLTHILDSVSDEAAACCDMLSTGFAGAGIGNIPIGGTVAVFTLGSVGLWWLLPAPGCAVRD